MIKIFSDGGEINEYCKDCRLVDSCKSHLKFMGCITYCQDKLGLEFYTSTN